MKKSLKEIFQQLFEESYAQFMLGAFALGAVFGIGYLVGKIGLQPPSPNPSKSDELKALAEKEQQWNNIQKDLQLTYYKELSNKPKTQPTETPSSSTEAPPILQEEAKINQELESTPKPANVAPEKPSSERMARALAGVLGSETPTSVKEAIQSSLPTTTGSPFAIQIASLPDRKAAEEMVKKLQAKNLPARLTQAEIAGRGVVYRVRLHGFKTREEAEMARTKNNLLEGITVAQ